MYTDKHTYIMYVHRQTNAETDMSTNKQTDKENKHKLTDIYTNGQTDIHTTVHTYKQLTGKYNWTDKHTYIHR